MLLVTHLNLKPSSVMFLKVLFTVSFSSFCTPPHSPNSCFHPLSIITSTLTTPRCSFLSPLIPFKGPSIYDVQKNQGFDLLTPSVHMSRTPPPCGRPHAVDMKLIH